MVGVLKLYRKKGVGTRLVLPGVGILKVRGMTKAMINVDDFNQTKALKLYKKVGFHIVNKYLTYKRDLT